MKNIQYKKNKYTIDGKNLQYKKLKINIKILNFCQKLYFAL